MRRNGLLALGVAAVLVQTALWHSVAGAGNRLAGKIEAAAAHELRRLEMPMVTARLKRRPLRRELILSGPADDFQRRELVRILSELPAVSTVRWGLPPARRAEGAK